MASEAGWSHGEPFVDSILDKRPDEHDRRLGCLNRRSEGPIASFRSAWIVIFHHICMALESAHGYLIFCSTWCFVSPYIPENLSGFRVLYFFGFFTHERG